MSRRYVSNEHVIINCSNCDKPLAAIWICDPEANKTWQVVVKCCYCRDKSFETEVKGNINVGGYGLPHPTEPDEVIPVTNLKDIDMNGLKVFVSVEKVMRNG
jgi:hypothetical protein